MQENWGLYATGRGEPQMAQVVKKPPANARDVRAVGLIPGLGRSPGEGNGTPLQYSYVGNLTGRGA